MSTLRKDCSRVYSFSTRFERSYIPEPNSGCWLWLGVPSGNHGYGRIKRGSNTVMAHRASWEKSNGSIPEGLLVLHKCDNPSCVNPDHLFLGTQQDNENDKVSKGRQSRGLAHSLAKVNPARRERNGNSRLKYSDVLEIRALKLPQRQIASAYGVTQALVSKIKRGEIWK